MSASPWDRNAGWNNGGANWWWYFRMGGPSGCRYFMGTGGQWNTFWDTARPKSFTAMNWDDHKFGKGHYNWWGKYVKRFFTRNDYCTLNSTYVGGPDYSKKSWEGKNRPGNSGDRYGYYDPSKSCSSQIGSIAENRCYWREAVNLSATRRATLNNYINKRDGQWEWIGPPYYATTTNVYSSTTKRRNTTLNWIKTAKKNLKDNLESYNKKYRQPNNNNFQKMRKKIEELYKIKRDADKINYYYLNKNIN